MPSTFVGNPAPPFDLPCTRRPDPSRNRARLVDYKGRWLALVFYPRDFSMVCPTELIGLSQRVEEFRDLGCDLLGVSCDPVELHDRWIATPKSQGGLGGLNFPLASDVDGEISTAYGVFDPRRNLALRGTFIVDPEGIIQYEVIHSLSIGRRSQEVLRVLTALQSGGLCREDWMTDGSNIDPYQILQPGNIFSHYHLDSEIGAGTFARVYLARDLQLDRPVALKVFNRDCPVTPSTALAEARSVAALNHPNICTIYAVDDAAGLPVIAMEYIQGRTLSSRLRMERPPIDDLLHLARQIAGGVAAAHDAGIIHGDLKPDNIMVADDGLVKVLDFGLARRVDRLGPVQTDETSEFGIAENGDGLFGTPRYLAPEQTLGDPATFASDVFSLGIVFYEMATGIPAFTEGNVLQVMHQIRNIDADAMAVAAGEPFTPLLRSMLVPDPTRRDVPMRRIVAEIDAVCESV
ncbi:protein kinase domain-containing protein [Paludisphaera rhizosphaerae]|uniref:protein kinase domain-containing protein n=1 Tax=Paludisphaera rhizosphaerae TaxID=2711216 RepID=UPI0013EB0AF9|nr:redoxin domain-containing protein [Paludisphaera rhizosphaerae]